MPVCAGLGGGWSVCCVKLLCFRGHVLCCCERVWGLCVSDNLVFVCLRSCYTHRKDRAKRLADAKARKAQFRGRGKDAWEKAAAEKGDGKPGAGPVKSVRFRGEAGEHGVLVQLECVVRR